MTNSLLGMTITSLILSRTLSVPASRLPTASWILRICVHHDVKAGMLFIEQSQYIKGVLSCYGTSGCTPVSMPLPPNSHFQPASTEEHANDSSYPYLEPISSLTSPTI